MNARIAAALIGLLLLMSTPAFSTTMVMMSDEALTLSSDAVVAGTVTDIRTARSARGMNTYITISVDETLKGYLGSTDITIRELGGALGDDVQGLFGSASYEVGESVIAFLRQNGDGTLSTNQMALGKFTIARDADTGEEIAVRHIDDVVMMLGQAMLQSHDPDSSRSAEGFKAHLRDVVRQQPVPMFRSPLAISPMQSEEMALGTEVAAFKLFNNMRWFDPDDCKPVRIFIDRTGDAKIGATDSIAAVQAAMKAWTDVPTASIVLESAGLSDPSGSFCDGTSKIVFNDPSSSVSDPNGCGGVLAVGGYCGGAGAKTVNGVLFHQIVEGDIVFNNGWGACSFWNKTNLAEVATHELGHTIGLAHSEDSTATMYAYAHFDGRGASLKQDDIAGVSFIYPEDGHCGGGSTPHPTATAHGPTPTPQPTPPPAPDQDGDGVPDASDNCPAVQNSNQSDIDDDGKGDACDNCVARYNPDQRAADACGLLKMKRMNLRVDKRMEKDALNLLGNFEAHTGRMTLPDIVGNAVTITVRDPNENVVVNETVPGGHWKSNKRGTRLTYRDRKGELGGLTAVTLYSRDGAAYTFSAAANGLDLSGGREPSLEVELLIGGDTYVSASGCSMNSRATRVRCKQKTN